MNTQKAIIFDSGALISFAMTGLLPELKKLKSTFKGKFLITQEVKNEVIDKPLQIKRFELEAINIKQLLDEKIIEMPSSLGVNDSEITKISEELKRVANFTFFDREKSIHIIDSGESSSLALSKILTDRGTKNVIAVDERTIRMLSEKPENLWRLLQEKLHTNISSRDENYSLFKGFKFIRSSELVYVIWKKGLARLKDGPVLDAMLWAVKFKGCSISGDEIREIENLK